MLRTAERMAERRSFGRRETAIAAVVVDGETRRDCIVRNFSDVGALLEFHGRFEAPERFVLLVDGNPLEGACQRHHQSGNKVGVSFRDNGIAKVLMREYQTRLADTAVSTAGEVARVRPALCVVPVSACALREQLLQKPSASKLTAKAETKPAASTVATSSHATSSTASNGLRTRRDNIVLPV